MNAYTAANNTIFKVFAYLELFELLLELPGCFEGLTSGTPWVTGVLGRSITCVASVALGFVGSSGLVVFPPKPHSLKISSS
jgi:hypothetical protein